MKDVFAVARTQLVCSLRERITLFWFLAFPLLLLCLLGLIFANVGKPQSLSFDVTVVDLDRGADGARFGAGALHALQELAGSGETGEKPLFRLREPAPGVDIERYVAEELDALRVGKRDAVVVIPAGFTAALVAAAAEAGREAAPATRIEVHTSGGRTSSGMALGIIEQIVARVDREILSQLGLYRLDQSVAVGRIDVGAADKTVAYIDFLVPGILLMGFFVAGLFSVPGTLLFGRETRVLRRYWVTPLDVPRFLGGFALGHLALCAVQFACVVALARLAFSAQVNFLQPLAWLYLVLGVVTFLAIGFLVTSLARTANAGMAIANIVNMPMMFLGGLFFPIGSVPPGLRVVLLANPVSYLADGLRASLGVSAPVFGHAASIAVPCAWIVGCVVVASFRLRWDVGK